MTTLIDWQNGLVLSPKLLKQHDQWMVDGINNTLLLNSTINNYGILDCQIDNYALNKGVLKINTLILIDSAEEQIINIKPIDQLKLNLFEEELNDKGSIYLNQYELKTKTKDINTIKNSYKLATQIDLLAKNSIELLFVENNNQQFKILDRLKPMIMLSHDLGKPLLERVNSYLNLIEENIIENSFSETLFIEKIKQIKFKITKSLTRQISLKTTELFENLVYLINSYSPLTDKELEDFNYYHNDLNQTFSYIFDYFDKCLSLPKKITQISFYKEDDYLITSSLTNDIIQAPKWYLIVQKKDTTSPIDFNPTWIKICSPSRKKIMDNLALSGTPLKAIKDSDLQYIEKVKDVKNNVYAIKPGVEFDSIIREKRVCCLINNSQALGYNYKIYYS